jgi:hypothetical protein
VYDLLKPDTGLAEDTGIFMEKYLNDAAALILDSVTQALEKLRDKYRT